MINKLKKEKSFKGGYTFLELIVVIAIFSIISSVVLFNSGNFSSNISLQNTTSDIALQIKEAQSDAISGRLNDAINSFGQEYYKPTYGVRFEKGSNEFTKFVDLPGSQNWILDDDNNPGACDISVAECLKKVKINGFDSISDICVRSVGASVTDCMPVETLDISFQRPFPDAVIIADEDTSVLPYNDAQITLISPKGLERRILINSVGNISIEAVQ